jgi:hypothetical protein
VAPPARHRVFLLSPARLDGVRAQLLFRADARSPIAAGLRTPEGVPLGEVFRFLSGLYFRGKLAYAQRFARPPLGVRWIGSGALVITHNRGLVPVETRVCLEHLEAFAQTDLREGGTDFRRPLERDAQALAATLGDGGEAVLLGSIATEKYTAPLGAALGDRLLFPSDFVGRGDMSRGGLLLRGVDASTELAYAKVGSVARHGTRPPKLVSRRAR